MSWRDNLRRVVMPDGTGRNRVLVGASFRGVAFFVENAELSSGRRTVTHEFPLRDDPYVEDLGRMSRAFRVDGYVLGDGYLAQRDALLAALEAAGPGELVHPYYGTKRAICTRVNLREATVDGGMAFFALEFAEAPVQPVTPTQAPDLAGEVSLSADEALAAVAAEFEDDFDVTGLPSFALASSSLALAEMSAGLGDALGPIVHSTQEMARMTQQVALITAQASSLVRTPGEIVGAFRATLATLVDTIAGAPGSVLQAFAAAYLTDTGPAAPETTATRQRERANQLAIDRVLRRVLAIEAARLAAIAEFDTVEAATDTRGQILEMLDEQAEAAGDAAYPALVQLRADVVRAVPGDAALARIVTIERREAACSLLLTYQLYGSVEQEADLVARNGIQHPGFISGTLQVLSDG